MTGRFAKNSYRATAIALLLISGYFSIALINHWRPAIGQTTFFFLYILSMPLVLATLFVMAVTGVILWARARHVGGMKSYGPFLACSLGGLALFGITVLAANVIERELPTGSHILRFDRALWLDERSSHYVEGDITPRQKMLGAVVTQVLPRLTRGEIEGLLGPSLDTPYFRETGRDLIYVTGAERDSMFGIDSEWLLIWLDENDRFKKYEIATD